MLKLPLASVDRVALLRALAFSVLLSISRSGVLGLLLFFFLGALLYLQPFKSTAILLWTSFILALTAFLSVRAYDATGWYLFAVCLLFGLLFYALLAIKYGSRSLSLIYVLVLGTFEGVGLLFFSVSQSQWFVVLSLIIFIISNFIFRDFFNIIGVGSLAESRAVRAALAFILVEAYWAIGLLPLGFLRSTGLFIALIYLLLETSRQYLTKSISAKSLQANMLVFTALVFVVLVFSRWTL